MNIDTLTNELTRDEGMRLKTYRCTANKLTIGIGRNLDDVGISEDEARYLLANDIKKVSSDLDRAIPWWRTLSEPRQRVLANMSFNLGTAGLLGFKNTLAMIASGDYAGAADGMLKSKWAKQVGPRATRLAETMRKG